MKTNRPVILPALFLLLALLLPVVPAAVAATMADYSIVPPFVQQPPTPNLLMIFDNSGSMYDLSYVDEGKKDTSGAFTRDPYYCYDQSYVSSKAYVGYFEDSLTTPKYYEFNFSTSIFGSIGSLPLSSACSHYRGGVLCVNVNSTSGKVDKFAARGFFLNWLTSSKFDVQKQVLTGGKYAGGNLLAESRGCVGQGFIKEPLTQDFVNWDGETNPNNAYSLGITFSVRGPLDPVNPSAPSQGGQTFIEIYKGDYNQQNCQQAVSTITDPTASQTTVRSAVETCLNFTAAASNYCQKKPATTCNTDTDCVVVTSGTKGTCRNRSSISCYYDTECYQGNSYKGPCDNEILGTTTDNGPCVIPGQTAVTKTKIAFTETIQTCWTYRGNGTLGNGDVTRLTGGGKCTDIYKGLGVCTGDALANCTSDIECSSSGKGSCDLTKGPDAILPGNAGLICGSSYLGAYYTGSAPAWDKSLWSSDSAGQIAAYKAFCDAYQPTVVDPTDSPSDTANFENLPAIISGIGVGSQLGQAIGTLPVKVASTTPTGLIQEFDGSIRFGAMSFNQFGSATEVNSTIFTSPDKPLPVQKACSNSACVGSVCSSSSSVPGQSCSSNADCPPKVCNFDTDCPGGSCSATTAGVNNLDGGKVLHYVGAGTCSSTTTTACATKDHCPTGEECINAGVGDHTTGLIKTIDNLRASAWTPFSEAFYNAMGYFAKTSSGVSRSALRINANDFNENLNPVQSDCQKNFALIVSDGMTTADRNSSVSSLASLYGTAATSGTDTGTCTSYAGSQNLDNLAWLARNRNIKEFSTSTVSTTAPVKESEYVSTYVVFNGASNGVDPASDCNSETLMSKTAAKGGGQYYQTSSDPSDPNNGLYVKLRAAFESIASVGSSATAASILSNSDNNGSNLLQALFYPSKYFGSKKISWLGELHGLWFYIDPYLVNSTIREDTDSDKKLKLKNDYVVHLEYNDTHSQTEVSFFQDTNADGSGDTAVLPSGRISTNPPPYLPDDMKSLWRGGRQLHTRAASDRNILTNLGNLRVPSDCSAYGNTLVQFSAGDSCKERTLTPYLDMGAASVAANVNAAIDVINYVRGVDPTPTDPPTVRSRTVNFSGTEGIWKLGDIIASTPKIQSGVKLQNYDASVYGGGYGDVSYYDFTSTTGYKQRGMAYVGANDGMLHAFRMGSFGKGAANTDEVSVITGTDIGKEEWAFIPKNALPYLKYLQSPDYTHLYYMDTSPTLLDASINKSSTVATCTSSLPYWDCEKDQNSWSTILIGGMGLGGATRSSTATCTNCVKAPNIPLEATGAITSALVGRSSYFALDVTVPSSPSLLWEFTRYQLGYTTSGPAIIRVGDNTKNGRWFAVFASGPTGPIDKTNHQFLGKSEQNLMLFVVDLATGNLERTIDTGIPNAFGASMLNSTLDTDKFDGRNGVYTDDVLYVGYVREGRNIWGGGTGVWDKGGVVRLATRDLQNTSAASYSPSNPGWYVNKVIDDIGPVTSGVGKIIDRQSGKLWLYFGTGRYFYRTIASSDLGTATDQLALYGITDPCFQNNDLDIACATNSSNPTLLSPSSDLLNQTTTISASLGSNKGWYINLDQRNDTTGYFAERVITDPVAASNGLVYFTSFKPSQDNCSFSGDTFLWVVKYDTGGAIPTSLKSGKIVLQVSTGAFQEVDIATAFTERGGRATTGLGGIPSGAGTAPSIISNAGMTPVRKILHVRER